MGKSQAVLSSHALKAIGHLEYSDELQVLRSYGRDWTRFVPPEPALVVWPRTTEEVVELVRWARQFGIGLVPSGGRTGLSGGAVAGAGEVVLSLDKMRALLDFDPATPALTVQAGMAVGAVQSTAAARGFYYPVDWAAAGSSQVGGSIATNAGGIRVLRYGMTREWVLGLQVVTGAGQVMALNKGLLKNNSGLDLRHLMIGSEGILAVITEATLRLTQPPPPQSVLLLALTGLEALMPTLRYLRAGLTLSAFEFFDRGSVTAVSGGSTQSFPIEAMAPFYVLAEFDDPEQVSQPKALALFEQLLEAGHISDGTVSQSTAQARQLWHWREGISEAIAHRTPYKNDLSVPIGRLPEFLAALSDLVAVSYPEFEVLWYGHLGDGNLHMNVLRPETLSTEVFHQQCHALSQQVFALVAAHGGSISAEHGVGLLKRDHLHQTRSSEELALMQQIKAVMDPSGILNPGKMLMPT